MRLLRMKIITLVSILLFSTFCFGQKAETIPKSFGLITNKCQSVLANMITGDLINDKGDDFFLNCVKGKQLFFSCSFIDKNKRVYAKSEMIGVIAGDSAILQNENNTDVFIISMMTRKFFSTSNVNIRNGALRGNKNCAGDFFYTDELKNTEKK